MAIEQGAVKFSQFNPQGLERTTFFQFFDAGMNLYPSGSNQQPNDFLDLTNVLPATSGGFRLRWGLHTMYTVSGLFNAVRTWPYNVTQDASDPADTVALDLIISTDNKNFNTLKVTNTAATTPLQNTLSLAAFTGTAPTNFSAAATVGNVGAVVSRRWFYTCNGINQPTKVYPGYITRSTAWNWGIVAPAAYTGATAMAATSTITAFGGTGNGYTSAPTVTISGGGGTTTATANAIIQNGSVVSFSITDPGAGYTSTPSVELSGGGGTGASAVAVYNNFGVIVAVLPSGPILLNEGRTYTYAWQNSVTGHTSDLASGISIGSTTESYTGNAASVLGPAVGIIGNVPAGVGFTQIFVTITPVVPIDVQIDTLVLMATSDGGSLEQLYGVALIPITAPSPGVITYTDTLPDTYSDSSVSVSGATIAVDAVFARYFPAVTTAFFGGVTSSSTPLCTQSFNSLMFNPHPTIPADGTVILAGYPVSNGNQQTPFQNAALTQYGTFSNNVPCGVPGIPIGINPNDNFQMVLTGNFIVAAAGNITFTPYIDAAFLFGLGVSGTNTPTYVSGPQVFNGYTTTPFEGYPCLAGIQNCLDWHTSFMEPFVINFPAAGIYPYEIGYATANHDEREMCLLADSTVIPPGADGGSYTGLTLLNANLWVDTDGYGNIFGIANNTPPPFGLLYPTLHQGRMFATDGKSLFFSKSIAEVTTSTGLITSKWEEAWPGTNSIPIGLNNEIILGLKSSGQTLHIGTAKSIYAMEGTDPTNFSIPSSLFQETGIISNDTWNTIYAQGKPAGYLWISPDLKVIFSDFNTFQDVGQPIYPIISTWTNTFNATAKVNSLTYGPYNLVFICFASSGVGTEFLIYETTLQKWYRWTVPANTSGPLSTFVYEHPETGYRALFLFQTTASQTYVACFDPQFSTDNTPGLTGASIPYNIQTSWSSLGDGLAFKTLNEVGVLTNDSTMTVSVYGARQQSDFASPSLLKSGALSLNPLGTYKFYMAGVPTNGIFYSFQFSNSTPAVSLGREDVLTRFIVESFPMSRF